MLKAEESDFLESLSKENTLFKEHNNQDFEEYRINNNVFYEELLHKLNNLILNLDRCNDANEFLTYLKINIYYICFFLREQYKIKKQGITENDFYKNNIRYISDNNFKEVIRNIIEYVGSLEYVCDKDALMIYLLLDGINDNINLDFSFEDAYMLLNKLQVMDKSQEIFYKHYIVKGSKLSKGKSTSNIALTKNVVYFSTNEFKKLDQKELEKIHSYIIDQQELINKSSLKIYFEEFKVENAEKKIKKPSYIASGRIGTMEYRIDDRFYFEEIYRLSNFVSNIDFKL